jgi:hypothetical protein
VTLLSAKDRALRVSSDDTSRTSSSERYPEVGAFVRRRVGDPLEAHIGHRQPPRPCPFQPVGWCRNASTSSCKAARDRSELRTANRKGISTDVIGEKRMQMRR